MIFNKVKYFFGQLSLVLLLVSTPGQINHLFAGPTPPSDFAEVWLPNGMAFDSEGRMILAHNDEDFNTYLSQFSPDGEYNGSIQTGTLWNPVDGRMIFNENANEMLWLVNGLYLYTLNPADLATQYLLNIQELNIQTNAVYEVVSGEIQDFDYVLHLNSCIYGDLTIFENGNELQLFVTGYDQTSFLGFVLRIRTDANYTVNEARVIAASRVPSGFSGPPEHPRGIAVNFEGTVLTTLPKVNESFFTFPADFEPQNGIEPGKEPRLFFESVKTCVNSQAMTCDPKGNFYVITDSYGAMLPSEFFPEVVVTSGVLIVLPKSLDQVTEVLYPDKVMSGFDDVAIHPLNGHIFISVPTWKENYYEIGTKPGRIIYYTNPTNYTTISSSKKSVPQDFVLNQNYPNPFNPTTTISFFLPKKQSVKVMIFNARGQFISSLVHAPMDAGMHELEWNAENLPSGTYFCRLQAGEFTATRKMMFIK